MGTGDFEASLEHATSIGRALGSLEGQSQIVNEELDRVAQMA